MTQPHLDNGFDSAILKLVEQYAACDKRSSALNEERKSIRDNAEKLGIPSIHFQHAVMRAKKMTKTERMSYNDNVERIVTIVEGKQTELWPEEAKKAEKRAKAKADAEAEAATLKGPDPDTNPRSDPKRGGAGKAKTKLDAKAAKIAADAEQPAEQVDLEQAIADRKAGEAEDAEHVFDNIEALGGPH